MNTVPLKSDPTATPPSPVIPNSGPWRVIRLADDARCWLTGYTTGADDESAATDLVRAARRGNDALIDWARSALGHGAALLSLGDRQIAVTDVAGTVPIYLARGRFHADPAQLMSEAGNGVDDEAALHLAMGGFTIGRRCLISGIEAMRPGEIAIQDSHGLQRIRHARYLCHPDSSADPRDPELRRRHNDLLLEIAAKLAKAATGRQILIPLSAGLDSRAVLCALKEVDCANIATFSYGLPGNHEAEGAARVAARLGVSWRMIDYSPARQRAFFESTTAQRFFAFADRPDAMPFMQDVPALERLIAEGGADPDAIVINGQSGDFIAGNHIPAALAEGRTGRNSALIAKHFDFWRHLKTPANLSRLEAAIDAELADLGPDVPDWAAYELLEYEARQSKYVCAGQRAYEFFDLDWRLPLWDARYVAFWRDMPLAAKRDRTLFREALEAANWGGVWGPDWVFPRTVVPTWLRPIRIAAKAGCAAFGREVWHRVEKRLFDWRMDPVQNYALVPYCRVATDSRGFRNALALHGEAYLARHGIGIDDFSRGGTA